MIDEKALIERGLTLFTDRQALTTLWQEIADQFYVQRADFTTTRYIGEEFANHLYSSYPLLVHRELSSSFAAMLRPRNKEWFRVSVHEEENLSQASKDWLEMASKRQRRAMYDTNSMFIRATTEGDGDFAAFGQCCISREINWNAPKPHLLYRCWHLRDVAWAEGYDGKVNQIFVKWKPTIADLKRMFPGKLHATVEASTQASQKIECMRIVVKADEFPGEFNTPWVVIYMDVQNSHVMNLVPVWSHGFTLPRWQTVSGSQYAYSPATVAGLPDARLLQAMSLTLLEAGEFAVRPPLVAIEEVIRSDMNWFPGGITYADADYDQKTGEILKPINQDLRALPYGVEVAQDQKEMLAAAFYLNKLTLPAPQSDMTAFEVGQRVEEYIRAALPLFEPMETQYNGAICEDTFDALMGVGVFGPALEVPEELQGKDIEFKFISPLHDAIERKSASTFLESSELINAAVEMDQTAGAHYDVGSALRDALTGIGVSPRNIREKEVVKEMISDAQEKQEAEQQLMMAEQAGGAAEKFAKADAA